MSAADGYERRTFDGLTVEIDRTLCVGFGDCIDVAPELFEFDDEGIVTFRADASAVPRDRLVTACDICPVDALVLSDADGTRIVPR